MVYCKRPKFCSFHRGRILKLFPSQNSAKVYLLDIGIVCDLFYNAIYEIPADLQDIRGIAFTVELVSIILKETEAFTQLHLTRCIWEMDACWRKIKKFLNLHWHSPLRNLQ